MGKELLSARRIWPVIFLLALTVLILVLRAKFITLPLDRDEGTYAYTAWRMQSGEMPYRDIFDHKPPLIYLFYDAAFKMFGVNYTAVRGFSALYVVLIMLAVFAAAWKMRGPGAAYISALLYSFYQSSVMMQGVNANTEIFLSLPLVLSVLAASGDKPGKAGYFISGALFAAAFFTKEMVVFSGVLMVLYWVYKRQKPGEYLFFFAGFTVFASGLLAWLAAHGLVSDFIKAGITGNISYAADMKGATLVPLLIFLGENAFLVIAALYSVFLTAAKRGNSGLSFTLVIAGGICIGIAVLSGRHTHYFLVLYPFLCIAAGIVLSQLWEELAGQKRIALAITSTVIFMLTFGAANYGFYMLKPAEISLRQYREPYFYAAALVSEYINGIKKPDDTLFCWASEPEIYFLTQMKSPVKLINVLPWYYEHGAAEIDAALRQAAELKPSLIAVETGAKPMLSGMLAGYDMIYSAGVVELYALKGRK